MATLVGYRWPGNVRELKNVIERLVLKAAGRPVSAARSARRSRLRQRDVARAGSARPEPTEAPGRSRAEELADQMLKGGESFWSAVFPDFKSRDLTRADLRQIIQLGLENTNGNYRLLVRLFNMPNEDYKRFLSFLRKHDCHLPFQRFRAARLDEQPRERVIRFG